MERGTRVQHPGGLVDAAVAESGGLGAKANAPPIRGAEAPVPPPSEMEAPV